jgi:hypothetical protein
MNDVEKLRVLLPHWITHNQEHAAEYAGWAEKAAVAGQETAAQMIRDATEAMRGANDMLQSALEELGGALSHGHHPH